MDLCPVCGEPVDEDEHDPHGHFDTTNVPCTICGTLPYDHPGVLPDDLAAKAVWADGRFVVGNVAWADHEYESGI
jgi:hypothetical protein